MDMIKEDLQTYVELLPVGMSISFTEAERRAGLFLEAMAKIANMRHIMGAHKIGFLSVQSVIYSEQMSKGTSNTMTANKITAEASKEYNEAREDLEECENNLNYLRAMYEIMTNGHLFYRSYAKENK